MRPGVEGLAALPMAELAAMRFFGVARLLLIWAMLAATALSGLQYLWRAALLLRTE